MNDRPDWAMVGVPAAALRLGQPGQVVILASVELSYAELEAVTRQEDIHSFENYVELSSISRTTYTLTVEMGTFTLAVADTYPEALANLLRTWAPKAKGSRLSIANVPALSLGDLPA